MHAIGRRIPVGIFFGELPNLRSGETLEGARPADRRERPRSADGRFDGGALAGSARVHPDRRRPAREEVANLVDERHLGHQAAEPAARQRVDVDAAVLLRRAGDGAEPAPVDVGVAHELGNHPVERLRPHHGRRVHDPRVGVGEHAVPRAVRRQRLVVAERALEEDRPPSGPADLDRRRRHALRAGIEPEIDRHDYSGTSQRPLAAERKTASMHAMFSTASSSGHGTSVSSSMACEKRSP